MGNQPAQGRSLFTQLNELRQPMTEIREAVVELRTRMDEILSPGSEPGALLREERESSDDRQMKGHARMIRGVANQIVLRCDRRDFLQLTVDQVGDKLQRNKELISETTADFKGALDLTLGLLDARRLAIQGDMPISAPLFRAELSRLQIVVERHRKIVEQVTNQEIPRALAELSGPAR